MTKNILNATWLRSSLVLLLLWAVTIGTVAAQGSGDPTSGEWEFMIESYLWAPEIGIATLEGDDLEISISDLFDGLDMAFLALMGARKGKWTVLFDTIYMNPDWEGSTNASLVGVDFERDLELDVEVWVLNLIASYAVLQTKGTRLEVLGGVRWMRQDIDFSFDVTPDIDGELATYFTVWDGVVGMRGVTNFSDKWYLSYYGDIGRGESDLTWQAALGVNRQFKHFTYYLGWRHLHYHYDLSSSSGGQYVAREDGDGVWTGFKFIF